MGYLLMILQKAFNTKTKSIIDNSNNNSIDNNSNNNNGVNLHKTLSLFEQNEMVFSEKGLL